jgi:hypothetical protein
MTRQFRRDSGHWHDLSRLKEADALEESEERYRRLFTRPDRLLLRQMADDL